MTPENRKLLLKDVCARIPFGVKFSIIWALHPKEFNLVTIIGTILNINRWGLVSFEWEYEGRLIQEINLTTIESIKPYLFPLSSMTDEQKKEFLSVAGYEAREEDCGRHTETYYYDTVGHEHNFYPNSDAIDWLNKNHFDYRGLIPLGLANDATGLNIY